MPDDPHDRCSNDAFPEWGHDYCAPDGTPVTVVYESSKPQLPPPPPPPPPVPFALPLPPPTLMMWPPAPPPAQMPAPPAPPISAPPPHISPPPHVFPSSLSSDWLARHPPHMPPEGRHPPQMPPPFPSNPFTPASHNPGALRPPPPPLPPQPVDSASSTGSRALPGIGDSRNPSSLPSPPLTSDGPTVSGDVENEIATDQSVPASPDLDEPPAVPPMPLASPNLAGPPGLPSPPPLRSGGPAEAAATPWKPEYPDPKGNPWKIVAENPNQLKNWNDALEKRYRQGSPEANTGRFQEELAKRLDGPRRRSGTNRNYAGREFKAVQKNFFKNENKNPTYKYTKEQKARLQKGRAPNPGEQGHHLQTIKRNPGRAVDPSNIARTSGGERGLQEGSSHWESHYGEGGRKAGAWEASRGSGGGPSTSATAPKPSPARSSGPPRTPGSLPKPPAAKLGKLGGRLFGLWGEITLIREVAITLELNFGTPDPALPEGTTRDDIWGNTYKKVDGAWVYQQPWVT